MLFFILPLLKPFQGSLEFCTKHSEFPSLTTTTKTKKCIKVSKNQGFRYFARSRTREIQAFLQNPAKFPKKHEIPQNPPEIFPNTCLQNIFNTYLGY